VLCCAADSCGDLTYGSHFKSEKMSHWTLWKPELWLARVAHSLLLVSPSSTSQPSAQTLHW